MSEKGDGRDHNPTGFTMWMAGGGVKGGQVIGATDELGLWAVQDRLHVHDLHATILHLLGIHNLDLVYRYKGRPETPTINEERPTKKSQQGNAFPLAIPAEWYQRLRSAKHQAGFCLRILKVMGNKVFVGGLSWDATDDDLKELFGECGTVTDGVILQDRETGRSRGFGFVTFSSDDEAKAAIEKFQDFEYMGRNLTVNEARPREDRGGGGVVVSAAAAAAAVIAAAAAAAAWRRSWWRGAGGSWRSWWWRRFPRQRQLVNLLVPEQAQLALSRFLIRLQAVHQEGIFSAAPVSAGAVCRSPHRRRARP